MRLRFYGLARLRLGELEEERLMAAMEAEEGGQGVVQWMGEGVGEMSLGLIDGPLMRWMTAWSGGDQRALGEVPAALRALARPPLPETAPGTPGRRLT